MPQNPFGGKQPIGIVYNTSMNRPDAVLALAELYGFEGKRESRMGSICVTGAGLNTAVYCDLLGKFYFPGPRNGNQQIPIGLALGNPLPPDAAMLRPAVEHAEYVRTIHKPTDTSLPEAAIRNGVIFNAEAAMILSAPATCFAKSLDLLGVKDLYKDRVKRLVIVDTGAPQQDVPALRQVLAEFPAPIFYCGKEAGEAVLFPAASLDKDFAWTPSHPVADAYRAYKPMPYDAPTHDLLAAHYAVHPDSGLVQLSEPGTLTVGDDGRMKFSPGGAGRVRSLSVDPAQKEKLAAAFVEIASAKPVAPQQRQRGPIPAKKNDVQKK